MTYQLSNYYFSIRRLFWQPLYMYPVVAFYLAKMHAFIPAFAKFIKDCLLICCTTLQYAVPKIIAYKASWINFWFTFNNNLRFLITHRLFSIILHDFCLIAVKFCLILHRFFSVTYFDFLLAWLLVAYLSVDRQWADVLHQRVDEWRARHATQ